jgi:hypothetical protein
MGRAEPTPHGVVSISRWDEPYSGWGKEVFYLVGEDELYVDALMLIDGRTVKYRTIYIRK